LPRLIIVSRLRALHGIWIMIGDAEPVCKPERPRPGHVSGNCEAFHTAALRSAI
jgi:hypothetical protein